MKKKKGDENLIRSKDRIISHGEVFTPPWIVKKMVDLVGEYADRRETTFLEPTCGSGNFLVEILERKISRCKTQYQALEALESLYGIDIMPDNVAECRARLGRIMEEYGVEGMAVYRILEKNIIVGDFLNLVDQSRGLFPPDNFLSHQRFDVVIGNPPYQGETFGHNRRAHPIYHLFVLKALYLRPKYMVFIIPSRWFQKGHILGIREFRRFMSEGHIRNMVDYPRSSDVFEGVDINGGVSYFLWDRDYKGDCEFDYFGKDTIKMKKDLGANNVVIRDPYGEGIEKKIRASGEKRILDIFLKTSTFGLPSNVGGMSKMPFSGSIPVYRIVQNHKRKIEWINGMKIMRPEKDYWKVLIPYNGGGKNFAPIAAIGKPWLAPPPSVFTQSFVGFYVPPWEAQSMKEQEKVAENLMGYICTKFFRYLVHLRKPNPDVTPEVFAYCPLPDLREKWTDEKLFERYGLSEREAEHIEDLMRPMEPYQSSELSS